MKKYQFLIIITVLISLIELVYYLTYYPIAPFATRMFILCLVLVEFIGLIQIWFQKKVHYQRELHTWPPEKEEKDW